MNGREFNYGAYFLKRGELIRGPYARIFILELAKDGKLLSGDQIATVKDGPWLDITEEPLQRMQQGRDIEINSSKGWLLIPPKDRDELEEWLRSNKDEYVVVCPFCGVSVKRRNLLKHCDKLHYSRSLANLKNTAFVVAGIVFALLLMIIGGWGLWGLGGWVRGLTQQGWANSGAFRVTSVCIGIAITASVCRFIGKEGVLAILGIAWFMFCCWGIIEFMAFLQSEFPQNDGGGWFRHLFLTGIAFFATGCAGYLGIRIASLLFIPIFIPMVSNESEDETVMFGFVLVPMILGGICTVVGGIGAFFIWLYQG